MIKLVKPDIKYFEQYKEIMDEWNMEGSRIAPWPLHIEYSTKEQFYEMIKQLDDVENGINHGDYASSTTYWMYDEENNRLIYTHITDVLNYDQIRIDSMQKNPITIGLKSQIEINAIEEIKNYNEHEFDFDKLIDKPIILTDFNNNSENVIISDYDDKNVYLNFLFEEDGSIFETADWDCPICFIKSIKLDL